MTQAEFVKAVAEKTGLTQKDVKRVINAMADVIVDVVKEGDTVKLADIGTFKMKEVPEKKARNPKTGEEITVPAHKKLVFKVSKKYKKI